MENKADLVSDVAAATPDLTDLPAYSAKDSASIETLEYTFSLPDHKGNESLKLKFATRATGQDSLNARGERLTDRIPVVNSGDVQIRFRMYVGWTTSRPYPSYANFTPQPACTSSTSGRCERAGVS